MLNIYKNKFLFIYKDIEVILTQFDQNSYHNVVDSMKIEIVLAIKIRGDIVGKIRCNNSIQGDENSIALCFTFTVLRDGRKHFLTVENQLEPSIFATSFYLTISINFGYVVRYSYGLKMSE